VRQMALRRRCEGLGHERRQGIRAQKLMGPSRWRSGMAGETPLQRVGQALR